MSDNDSIVKNANHPQKIPRIFLRMIRSIILLPIIYFVIYLPYSKYFNSSDWIKTQCKIISLNFVPVSKPDGRDPGSYYYLKYEYRVDNKLHTGTTYGFESGEEITYLQMTEIRDSIKKDDITNCFYNPRNPDEAVIDRKFALELANMSIGLCMIIFYIFWKIFVNMT